MPQYIVSKQIAVEAETPEEAVAKSADGNSISLQVFPRPPQAQNPMPLNQPITAPK